MATDRRAVIEAFLEAHGWGEADRSPLAADASFRRYQRLRRKDRTAVLMDAPPPFEKVLPFREIARHLSGLGYSAPRIYGNDDVHGLLLLEDLGDDTFSRMLAAGGDQSKIYGSAVDVLIDLHRRPAGEVIPPRLPAYDDRCLLAEANLFLDWVYPAASGGAALGATARRSFAAAWLELFTMLPKRSETLVLRDYHVDNLIWLPHRTGVGACGLLDFQDALAGPAAYDLMSLLEDARRDISGPLKAAMLGRYLAAFPDLDQAAFKTVFHILAAQRHAKVIGIFNRLHIRDGKSAYLGHLPRVWGLLREALENPPLDSLKKWFDTHVPGEIRAFPMKEKTT